MRSRILYLASLLTTVFLVLLVAATLATRATRASPGTLYVATTGDDGKNCDSVADACRTVQRAINVATTGDEIRVATGTYTDTSGTVAAITETITLQGGWDTGFTTQDPNTYPTTLDAQRQGRVVYITGYISPTIDGFIITGGNADGETFFQGYGGGIHSRLADAIIQNNVITNNIASTVTDTWGIGGGLYLFNVSASAVISGNQILSNTASTGYYGMGGGLFLESSDATFSGNTVQENKASTAGNGWGGGLYLNYSSATVSRNTISDNTASTVAAGLGGGLYLSFSNPTLDGNRIISNTALGGGGGLYVSRSAPFTLTNNIIAQNRADGTGGGIRVWGQDASFPSNGTLINNTFAQNNLGTYGEGIYALSYTTLTLTNNIVVSHTYGIYVVPPATATADYTLFFGNTTDTWGSITSTNEITGDPLFVDPAAWDYHIQVASPAVNSGTFNGAPATDFESDPRPWDCFIDIGADENIASDECKRIYLPLILKDY